MILVINKEEILKVIDQNIKKMLVSIDEPISQVISIPTSSEHEIYQHDTSDDCEDETE